MIIMSGFIVKGCVNYVRKCAAIVQINIKFLSLKPYDATLSTSTGNITLYVTVVSYLY